MKREDHRQVELATSYKVISVREMALIEDSPNKLGRYKSALTLVNTYTKDKLILYREHETRPNCLYIPRALIRRPADDAGWPSVGMNFTGKLRPEQQKIVDAYIKYIDVHNGGIIKSGVGTGKTVMGISIAALINMPTLIVVPTEYLMNQWRDRLKTFSNLKDSDIGTVRGSIFDVQKKKVVLGMIHSLCKPGRYPQQFYKWPGLMIVDEVHTVGAETFSVVASLFWSMYRLGLSATPRRKDGMEKAFFYHIGGICSEAIPIPKNPKVIFVPFKNLKATDYGCVIGNELNLGKYYTRLSKIPERNVMLSQCIRRAFDKGRDVLVLSERLSVLNDLEELLKLPKEIGRLTGTSKRGLDRKIILATYQCAGLGADIKRLSTVVLATPRVDVEQAIGRILRDPEAKTEPVVIDIIDEASDVMRGWAMARLRFYRTITDKIHFLKEEL